MILVCICERGRYRDTRNHKREHVEVKHTEQHRLNVYIEMCKLKQKLFVFIWRHIEEKREKKHGWDVECVNIRKFAF